VFLKHQIAQFSSNESSFVKRFNINFMRLDLKTINNPMHEQNKRKLLAINILFIKEPKPN